MSFDFSEKWRRKRKMSKDRKFKERDRFRFKMWLSNLFPLRWLIRRMDDEKDWTFGSRKTHSDTGFGTGREKNPESKKYRNER